MTDARACLCAAVLVLSLNPPAGAISGGLLFGAFNIQALGVTKMGNTKVVGYLTEILDRYDVVFIQEYRDSSGKAIKKLLNSLNKYSTNTYKYVISTRMGRSSYKEQYVYFYNDNVDFVDSYEYIEIDDEFERQPFIVRFQQTSYIAKVSEFVVAGIHVKPDDAVAEIDELVNVYDDIVARWGIKDVVLAGDFNADCDYVSSSAWSGIRLRTESRFHWLIPDTADTTVAKRDCAYDRLVVAGNKLIRNTGQAKPYYFDVTMKLKKSKAKKVSDHYPVEMIIQ